MIVRVANDDGRPTGRRLALETRTKPVADLRRRFGGNEAADLGLFQFGDEARHRLLLGIGGRHHERHRDAILLKALQKIA